MRLRGYILPILFLVLCHGIEPQNEFGLANSDDIVGNTVIPYVNVYVIYLLLVKGSWQYIESSK